MCKTCLTGGTDIHGPLHRQTKQQFGPCVQRRIFIFSKENTPFSQKCLQKNDDLKAWGDSMKYSAERRSSIRYSNYVTNVHEAIRKGTTDLYSWLSSFSAAFNIWTSAREQGRWTDSVSYISIFIFASLTMPVVSCMKTLDRFCAAFCFLSPTLLHTSSIFQRPSSRASHDWQFALSNYRTAATRSSRARPAYKFRALTADLSFSGHLARPGPREYSQRSRLPVWASCQLHQDVRDTHFPQTMEKTRLVTKNSPYLLVK